VDTLHNQLHGGSHHTTHGCGSSTVTVAITAGENCHIKTQSSFQEIKFSD